MINSIKETIQYIDKNIKTDINLYELANHVNYSLSYLHNIFFKVTGQSIAAYIRRRKIQHSAQLLIFETMPISNIATIMGYTTHEAFTRAFKSTYGVTPKKFRSNPINRELFKRLGSNRSQKSLKEVYENKKGNIIIKTSGNIKNLDGVRQVTFYNGSRWCPEDIPFPSCMSSVMEFLGEKFEVKQIGAHKQKWNLNMGNIYFLGWSGMAFGLLWKNGCEFTDTDIDNIEFVEKLPNIIEFWAYCNNINDISPLKNCQKLNKTYFYNCPITDISVCRNIPTLCVLAINETGVSDISPIKNNTGFVYLDAHDAELYDISALENMLQMNYLTLAGNYITDITPLLKMQKMNWLTLEVGEFLSFDKIYNVLPNLKALKTVALSNCNFTESDKKILQNKMYNVKIKFNEFGVF